MGIVKVSAAFAAAQCWTREVTFEAVHGWGQFGLSTAGYWEPLVSSLAVVAVDNPWKLSPVVDSGTILAAQEKNSGRGWFQCMVPAVGSAVTKERGGR